MPMRMSLWSVRRIIGAMELRHLRTFLAVAEELHFGAAADRLFLSPPAVTEHIQALEREVGVSLFERSRPIRLTEAGAVLVGHARDTLAHAAAALDALREYSSGEAGHLRVGILSNGAGVLTPLLIRAFMDANPLVRVSIRRLNFSNHLTAVLEHRVDVAFVRPAPKDDRVRAIPLSEEPRVVVLPAQHPMADASEISPDDVLDEPFVGVADGVPDTFVDYLHLRTLRGGIASRTVDVGCSDVTDVLASVSAGRGVASAVESFRGYENWPGVSYVTLFGAEASRNVLLSRAEDPSPIVASFISLAQSTCSDLGVLPGRSQPPQAGHVSPLTPTPLGANTGGAGGY